ncbi:hypothetical protein B0H15DRAFT_1019546 [Mycena belliarum]|uniref:Uncharacterized protein n=1 Tax=Mycena belliarum TaxID=1033014 RepID=A0AAD6UFZ4_9AGAR|nr:hypothetical protein B0H15DRAFT_1019546 [Mycena belliae]
MPRISPSRTCVPLGVGAGAPATGGTVATQSEVHICEHHPQCCHNSSIPALSTETGGTGNMNFGGQTRPRPSSSHPTGSRSAHSSTSSSNGTMIDASSSSTLTPSSTLVLSSSSFYTNPTDSNPATTGSLPAIASSSIPTFSATSGALSRSDKRKIPIIAGLGATVIFLLAAAALALALHKRWRRARDRRAWERTHAEIADAVNAGRAGALTPPWGGYPREKAGETAKGKELAMKAGEGATHSPADSLEAITAK